MHNRNGQIIIGIVTLFSCRVVVLFFVLFMLPVQNSFFIILGCVIFVIAFVNTDLALVILIFSMLLSPELNVGGIPGRAVVIRVDDIFLFVVFLGWLAKMAVNKELGLFRATPINRPIIAYISICLVATFLGIIRGDTNIRHAFFYLLKYIEYFLLFFMVVNNLRTRKQAKVFVFFILLACFLVCLYAWWQIPAGGRVSAPFEGRSGEPNTFAGYLLLMMGITLGIFIYIRQAGLRFLLGGFFIFISIPFLYTLSRGGWLGFLPMYLAFLILSRRGKGFLLLLLISVLVLAPFIFPKAVTSRARATFTPGKTYAVLGREITIDESGAARIASLESSLKKWSKRPILGYGVPGGGSVSDVQYGRILREIGVVGFLAFIWLMVILFKTAWRSFTCVRVDDFGRGLSLGLICALVGLLVMGVAAEVFIIVRIMEPFWFLAAIVVVLPEISPSVKETNG